MANRDSSTADLEQTAADESAVSDGSRTRDRAVVVCLSSTSSGGGDEEGQGSPKELMCEEGLTVQDRSAACAPPGSISDPMIFVRESLQTLALASPAARARLHLMKAGIVLAWQQHADATSSALRSPGSSAPHPQARRDPGQALPSSASWAITALDRMAVDDPLWSCKISLLRWSILAGAAPASTLGAGGALPGRQLSGQVRDIMREIAALPVPFGGAARAFRDLIVHQLCSDATAAVIESLFAANAVLSPAERPLACWIPCLIALAGRHRDGCTVPGTPAFLDFIGEHAKQQLSKLPPSIATTWLVGRDQFERCAARLLALVFMRRGITCFPWTSESPPKFGRYLVAGIGIPAPAGQLPANCLGTADLIAEARQNHVLACAASHWGSAGSKAPIAQGPDGSRRTWMGDGDGEAVCSGCSTSCPSRSEYE